jgi:hypothetical protein
VIPIIPIPIPILKTYAKIGEHIVANRPHLVDHVSQTRIANLAKPVGMVRANVEHITVSHVTQMYAHIPIANAMRVDQCWV